MKKYSNISKILSVIALVGLASAMISSIALANPLTLPQRPACQTSSATSSPSLIATSTATTTLACDLYTLTTGQTNPTAADSASLAIQFRAPQTTTVLAGTLQYSSDGVDWYDDNVISLATTTTVASLDVKRTFTWTAGTTATTSKIVSVLVPTRYIRVQFTATAGSATSSVWAEFIPVKQRPE